MQKQEWMELGTQLRNLREKNNMTRVEFSFKLNISEETLKNYENLRTKVPDDVIKRACEQFPVMPNYFYMEESDSDLDGEELLELFSRATKYEKEQLLAIARIVVRTQVGNNCNISV